VRRLLRRRLIHPHPTQQEGIEMPFEVQHQVEIPANTFMRAKLNKLDVASIQYVDKKTGEQKSFDKLNWIFEITEQGEFTGKDVRAETSAYLSDHPENKFRQWSEALLQRPLDLGQVLNEADLEGLSGLIMVSYVEDRKDPSKKWPRVTDVIPLDPSTGFNEAPF
jgi:hypothetical protein